MLNHKGAMRVVFLALKGRHPYVMSRTHMESVLEFNELTEWLRAIPSLDGMWTARGGSMLVVKFDGGGSIRFVSSPQHLDGVDIGDAHIDEFLRTATKGG